MSAIAHELKLAEDRFRDVNPNSKKQHELALGHLPGGNTRSLIHTSPFPLCMKQGKGAFVWDIDGHKYTDFVGELTAGMFGHSHPVIREAVISTFDNVGVSLGATTVYEQRYADLMCSRFGLERVRFANSGTEANLHAIAAVRGFTGKRKIVVFSGAYHGAVFAFGTGKAAPNNVDPEDFIVVPCYNDIAGATAAIKEAAEKGNVAAVLVEPMQGSGGGIPGTAEFIAALRKVTQEVGVLLIIDEVMLSRQGRHGMSDEMGVKPDMKTFGKYLGGGFAFGAFGGREDVMAVYDPRLRGALFHSGTFNNNTMAMCAGYAGLSQIYTEDVAASFTAKGEAFMEKLQAVSAGTKLMFSGRGTIIVYHFLEDGRRSVAKIEEIHEQERTDLKDLFWFEMLAEGFWMQRRGMMALVLETPDEELDRFVAAVGSFLQRYSDAVRV